MRRGWSTAALATLLCLLPAGTAGAGQRRSCHPAGSKTVAVAAGARVFKARDGRIYGCLKAVGRPRYLWAPSPRPEEETAFDLPRLAGPYAAFVDYWCDTAGSHVARVRVVDLRSGAVQADLPALSVAPVPHERQRVVALQLSPEGSASWTATLAGLTEVHAGVSR